MATPGIPRRLALLARRLPWPRAREGHRRPLARGVALIAGPVVLVLPLAASAPSLGISPTASGADRPATALTVNWALAGQASATSSVTNNPAANAIAGHAGTAWGPDA